MTQSKQKQLRKIATVAALVEVVMCDFRSNLFIEINSGGEVIGKCKVVEVVICDNVVAFYLS